MFNIKLGKSVLITKSLYLEDENHKEVNFNREALTFTLHSFETRTLKRVFKNLKQIHIVLEENIDLLQQTFVVI